MLAMVKCRKIMTDDENRMNPKLLEKAIVEDRNNGLIPFLCVATLGTTSLCSFDDLSEIGPICNKENIWLHIDAAYAGSAFICPEFRHLLNGVEYADSFNFNPHKWLLVHFDCSTLWLKNSRYMVETFNVDPLYLQHTHGSKVLDYRHWQIPLGRRFRSLKIWFSFRSFGIKGLQEKVRKDVSLAKEFERLVSENEHFEIVNEVILGLVCFRLKGENEINKILLDKLVKDGRIYLVSSEVKGVYFLRFCVCASKSKEEDVHYAWNVIVEVATPMIDTANNLEK